MILKLMIRLEIHLKDPKKATEQIKVLPSTVHDQQICERQLQKLKQEIYHLAAANEDQLYVVVAPHQTILCR